MAFQNQPGCGCCGAATPTDCVTVQGCLNLPVNGATVEFLTSADAVIVACETGSAVGSISVTNGGTGYTSAPTVIISGGGGSGATAHAFLFSGRVSTVAIDNPGTGYTSAPTVTFSGGGGSGATATAALAAKCCTSPSSTPAKIRVTPPSGSGYAAITVTRTSNNQTVTLSTLPGWTCTHQGCCPPSEDPATPPWQQVFPPDTIYINDGFGTVALNLVTGGPTQWIGCATRTASSGFADCTTPSIEPTPNLELTVFFSLACSSSTTWVTDIRCGGFGAPDASGICAVNAPPVNNMNCDGSITPTTCCRWFSSPAITDVSCVPTFSGSGSASIAVNSGLWYIYGETLSIALSG